MTEITSYGTAADYLNKGRDKTDRPLKGNGTRLQRRGSAIAVNYRGTDVVTYFRDGLIALDRGGYLTKTTADRMETYSPFKVKAGQFRTTWSRTREFVRRGPHRWIMAHPTGTEFSIQDGMAIDPF